LWKISIFPILEHSTHIYIYIYMHFHFLLPQNFAEACLAAFGADVYPCFSYDIDKDVATIVVNPATDTASVPTDAVIDSVVLPEWSENLKTLAFESEVVDERTIQLEQALGFPIFQIPYDGPFIPPGTGFGINGRLANPQYVEGEVVADTCETWTVTAFPPG